MTKNVLILMDDVHLEGRPPEMQEEFAQKIKEKIRIIRAQGNHPIVICAGDIGEGIAGVKWASQFACDILYICGNHEFWGGDFYQVPLAIKEFVALPANKHIRFLDKDSCIINGTRFIGATLWTSLGAFLPWFNKNYVVRFFGAMGDFKRTTAGSWYTPHNSARLKTFLSYHGIEEDRIKEVIDNKLFNPLMEIEENQQTLQYFIGSLSKPFAGNTIVVSHHLPVYELWAKKMGMLESSLNGDMTNNEKFFLDCAKGNVPPSKDLLMMSFYVNDLKDLMYGEYAPSYWLHGHLHQEMEDIVGRTQIMSCPVGYYRQAKEMKFKEIKVENTYKFVTAYIKKEIEEYNWNEKLYEPIRSLEKLIPKFELGVSTGILTSNDFEPILKGFHKNHGQNLEDLKVKVNEWLKLLLYAANPHISDQKIDTYLIKKILAFSDAKYKFPEVLAAAVNDHSFLPDDKFRLANQGGLPYYHYKDWLKELHKIQIQLSLYKKSLLEFCDEFASKK